MSGSVVGMCFDTTAVNTGAKKGTCILLENKLGKRLLYLACRHHTNELVLRSVVEACRPQTSGPNVPIFSRFQRHWDKIDKQRYKTGMEDEVIAIQFESNKEEIKEFILIQFEILQPRADYRELLELAYIFLGGVPPRGIYFKLLGAMHHARWLSKAICINMIEVNPKLPHILGIKPLVSLEIRNCFSQSANSNLLKSPANIEPEKISENAKNNGALDTSNSALSLNLTRIDRKVDRILALLGSDERTDAIEDSIDLLPEFPLNSVRDFVKFTNELSDDRELRKKFQTRVRRIGGKSGAGHITNVLVMTLTNRLGTNLTWDGQRATRGI